MVLLYTVYLFPFGDRDAWYSHASSLHTDGITSFVLVLPLYFSKVGSIISINFPLRLCHLIGKQEFSACFTSASNSAVSPQITSSFPFIQIPGPIKKMFNTNGEIFEEFYQSHLFCFVLLIYIMLCILELETCTYNPSHDYLPISFACFSIAL